MKLLKDLFLDELADMYDAERRILKALPKMAKAATCEKLGKAFQNHLKETQGHVKNLERVFRAFGAPVKGKTCQATVGLLKEGDELASTYKGSPALDAALISAGQKVEHYEIASYGCLCEWAGLLGNKEAKGILEEILDEEENANDTLTNLARNGCDESALGDSNSEEEDDARPNAAKRPENLRQVTRPASGSRNRSGTLLS